MGNIVIFYYIEQYLGWEIAYHKHLHDLQVTGLYEACDSIFIINSGEEPLEFQLDKIQVLDKNSNALDQIYEFSAEHPGAQILYIENKHNEQVAYNSHRLCSEYFTIHHWQSCVEQLKHHDIVGVMWQPDQNRFLVNNFWLTSDYMQRLRLAYLYCQIRLGTNSARIHSCFDYKLSLAEFLSPLDYINIKPDPDVNNVAVFYHVGQLGNWQHVYQEQIHHLVRTGLYATASVIHLGVNGDEELPFLLPKIQVNRNPDKILEAHTLESLWLHCHNNPDDRVLYIHTKGVSRNHDRFLKYSTYTWRTYLEHFNIHCWRHNLHLLREYECVGTEWRDQAIFGPTYKPVPMLFYDGNFWWARADYIRRLSLAFLYGDTCENPRMNSEFWIGTGTPRHFNYFNYTDITNENVYLNPQLTHKYLHHTPKEHTPMTEKKTKIVAIVMFRNEARVLRRMLDSCLPHVDYYVFQNNGSTDGSEEIAKNFLLENKLSGTLYEVEEGWVGFGWNRDHLLQYCQKEVDHGCDWILKMDCDEVLEVDPDFDWSILDDTSIQAFHIPAVQGSTIYHRAWMWNAKLPWRFNHDKCHETIYCEIPEIGAAFQRVDLPTSFRQIGYNEGQSWSVPTKFATDALLLEERMIKENTMLSNLYHFWYIGKSYFDAWPTNFELGEPLKRNFAERAIFYFKQYVDKVHNYYNTGMTNGTDELAYMGLIFAAESYRYLGDMDSALKMYHDAGYFAPPRNDHIWGMATLHKDKQEYDQMLACTSIMMQPERVNPFPTYAGFINFEMYHNTGTALHRMHKEAQELAALHSAKKPFSVNTQSNKKRLIIVDDFYADPDAIRNFALSLEYEEDLRWYKGLRSKQTFATPEVKKAFEEILGVEVFDFDTGYNGCFQITTAENPQVYHYDSQRWAAMIYLTPDAPVQSGTRLHKSRINGTRHSTDPDSDSAFNGNFYDSTRFDVVDSAGNVYNRLVLMDARSFHSAGPYFGDSPETGRLIQLFFFN